MAGGQFPICAEGYVGSVGIFSDREITFFEIGHYRSKNLQQVVDSFELQGTIGALVFICDQAEGPSMILAGVLDDNSDIVFRRVSMQDGEPQ